MKKTKRLGMTGRVKGNVQNRDMEMRKQRKARESR